MECTPENPCTAMQLLAQKITVHDEEIGEVKEGLESLKNRLPLWATTVLTGAGTAIGILASHIK